MKKSGSSFKLLINGEASEHKPCPGGIGGVMGKQLSNQILNQNTAELWISETKIVETLKFRLFYL